MEALGSPSSRFGSKQQTVTGLFGAGLPGYVCAGIAFHKPCGITTPQFRHAKSRRTHPADKTNGILIYMWDNSVPMRPCVQPSMGAAGIRHQNGRSLASLLAAILSNSSDTKDTNSPIGIGLYRLETNPFHPPRAPGTSLDPVFSPGCPSPSVPSAGCPSFP